jgi:NodT family efflux transporter outer membrane factor (OMF) lipoprotein
MRYRKKLALSLMGLLLASGCEVGPDYKAPEVTVRPAFAEAASTQPSAGDLAALKWWEAFGDAELNSLISRAMESNLDMQEAESRLRQARAQRGVVGADLWPTANVSAGYQNGRGSKNVVIPQGAFGFASPTTARPIATPALVRAAGTPATVSAPSLPDSAAGLNPLGQGGLPGVETQLYQGGFDASWELDIFGGNRRAVEAADAVTGATIEDRRDILLSLEAEVARNYVELRLAQRQLQIAADNLHDQQETLKLTQSRYRAGFVTDLDVARQAAQVAATAATLPAFEAEVRHSIHQMGILLGEDPDALTDELEAGAPIPPAPPAVPVGLPVELVRRRPDIRRAERELAAASARIGVATADLYPKFSLTGSFGVDSSNLNNLVEWNSRYFAINPGVSWPIFDAGRIRSNIAVQKELARQAALDYQQTVLMALGEVEDALANYRLEQIRRRALADSVEASQQAVDLARQQYQRGVIDFLAVLDAQRDLFEAQTVLAESDGAVSTDLVAIYKALGGGWEMGGNGGGNAE